MHIEYHFLGFTSIKKANRCDQVEDQAYKDQTGYEVPEDLKHKQTCLKHIQAAKAALEHREQALNSGFRPSTPKSKSALPIKRPAS